MVKTSAGVASVIETLEKRAARKKTSVAAPRTRTRVSAERSRSRSLSTEPEPGTEEPGRGRDLESSSPSSSSLDLASSPDEFRNTAPAPASALKRLKTRHRTSAATHKSDSASNDNDFQWMAQTEDNSSTSSRTLSRDRDTLTPLTLRRRPRGTGSLDRSQLPRKERDKRCKSTSSYPRRLKPSQGRCFGSGDLGECCWHGSNPYLNVNFQRAQMFPCHHCAVPICCQMEHAAARPRYPKPPEELEDQFKRLENDKDSLQLQVVVLSDQIDAQSEKISDLEKSLAEQKERFESMKELLQKELLAKSSLETQKLELLSVVTDQKRQIALLELENNELKEFLREERKQRKPPIAPRLVPFPPPNSHINMQTSSPSYRRPYDHYGSLPRQSKSGSESPHMRKGVMFAETENTGMSDVVSECGDEDFSPHQSPSLNMDRSRGIRKILGKLKRSNSGNLDDTSGGEFQRGGLRATANGRLTSSNVKPRPNLPFSDWSLDSICDWLTEKGLDSYVNAAKKWIVSGTQLLNATSHDLEKHLGIKNALHRKKLLLALQCERGDEIKDPLLLEAGKLETVWVLRWLDDVGLPQYKDSFLAARINGATLHRLTLEDLAALHISSVLHVASLRCGIQVLRNNKFEPNCLCRRSVPGDATETNPSQVALWTNHRVMEWLRIVDLAEYAPNLRGSGVHGGLIMFEPRFNAELLASLLSIPPQKTLLRRHLSTHFKELLGRDVIQIKRDAEVSLGHVPLSATAKIKIPKKTQFTLKRKKSKSNIDYGDLICPMEQASASILNIVESGDELSNSALSLSVSLSGKSGINHEIASEEPNGSLNQNVSTVSSKTTK
ncbi:uncharacterized protein Liprin-beta isoform X2 [Bemisia tabaci]|uniref:uncharacterized protein Liprin-beta isoform X2 n=1 Tax=Bemisia tabaci TaxID=7038 RepID=UPI003B27CBAC